MAESKKSTDFIAALEKFYKQLPNLPESIREVLVKIAPWLALIFGILGVIVGLGALGLSPVALLGGLDASFIVLVTGVVAIVASVLMLMAFPKLQKRQYKGWELLFWSEVVSVVSAVISFSVGSILGVLIGFYCYSRLKVITSNFVNLLKKRNRYKTASLLLSQIAKFKTQIYNSNVKI